MSVRRCIECGVGPIGKRKNARFCPACAKRRQSAQSKAWVAANKGRAQAYQREYQKRRRARDPEAARERSRRLGAKWYWENVEHARTCVRTAKKARYDKDPDRFRAARRAYYATLPAETRRQREQDFRNRNPWYSAGKNERRRAALAGVECTLTTDEWFFIVGVFDGRCAYCDAPATEIDHIVPVTRGGGHTYLNVLPACKPCNSSKGAKRLVEWL